MVPLMIEISLGSAMLSVIEFVPVLSGARQRNRPPGRVKSIVGGYRLENRTASKTTGQTPAHQPMKPKDSLLGV